MNRKVNIMAAALIGLLVLTSCSTKRQAINQLDCFSTELQQNSGSYSLADWKKASERLTKIHKKIGKHDYTLAEKKEIAMIELKNANAIKEGLKESAPNILFDAITDWNTFYEELKSLLGL